MGSSDLVLIEVSKTHPVERGIFQKKTVQTTCLQSVYFRYVTNSPKSNDGEIANREQNLRLLPATISGWQQTRIYIFLIAIRRSWSPCVAGQCRTS